MKQRRIVMILAIIAVTGAVSVLNSLAMAWQLDVSDRHVVDRGGLAWDPLIHTVADTDLPPNDSWPQNENYSRYGSQWGVLREHGASQSERSRYGMEDKSRSAAEERQVDIHPYGNYFRNDQSSAFPTTPYHEMIHGGVPTTPSADPLVGELSREPSER